jgi:hypothetical protein
MELAGGCGHHGKRQRGPAGDGRQTEQHKNSSIKEDGTVKVGTEEYKKYVVKLEVVGKFRYIANSKK